MVEINYTIGITLSLVYAISLSLSKGIQKYGIEGVTPQILKQWKTKPELKRKFYAWGIGSIGTTIAAVVQVVAQNWLPNASFIAAFGGVGLGALAIFSFYVLKEKLKAPEIIGVIIVVVSTIIFTIPIAGLVPVEAEDIDYVKFALLAIIPLACMFLVGIISTKHNFWGHAIIWGAVAGFFSGLGISLSQTSAAGAERDILAMLATPDLYLAFLTGQGAFWFTQYGFKHGHATIVVTLYNTLMLGVPVLVDIIVFGQSIPPLQILMIVFIGIGIVLLTAFRKDRGDTARKPEEISVTDNVTTIESQKN
jgi:drug/metabolite transporter (DMT)-like permease